MRANGVNGAGMVAAWLLSVTAAVADDALPEAIDRKALEALRAGEAVVLMRHALAPGTGDPASFTRGDCTTQRNLSEPGRAQARAIGERLSALLDGRPAEVYSSAWCRCLDTARLLDIGPVEPLPALDSFFRERDAAAARTDALAGWMETRLGAEPAAPTAVLVTHQVNVTALTGVFPSSGELLVLELGDGDVNVLASIETDVPSAATHRRPPERGRPSGARSTRPRRPRHRIVMRRAYRGRTRPG